MVEDFRGLVGVTDEPAQPQDEGAEPPEWTPAQVQGEPQAPRVPPAE